MSGLPLMIFICKIESALNLYLSLIAWVDYMYLESYYKILWISSLLFRCIISKYIFSLAAGTLFYIIESGTNCFYSKPLNKYK